MRAILVQFVNRILGVFSLKIIRTQSLIQGMDAEVQRKFLWTYAFLKTKNLPGDVAEFGVATGSGLAFWMHLNAAYKANKVIWAIDSFQGFPPGTKGKDSDWFNPLKRKDFEQYSVEYVKSFLFNAGFDKDKIQSIRFIEGFIPVSLEKTQLQKISLANLDMDLYQSTLDALKFVWPRLVDGGMVIFDEYDSEGDSRKWPGSKLAIDEFCAQQNISLTRHFTGRVYLTKYT